MAYLSVGRSVRPTLPSSPTYLCWDGNDVVLGRWDRVHRLRRLPCTPGFWVRLASVDRESAVLCRFECFSPRLRNGECARGGKRASLRCAPSSSTVVSWWNRRLRRFPQSEEEDLWRGICCVSQALGCSLHLLLAKTITIDNHKCQRYLARGPEPNDFL